jgi:hypothetical protein
MMPADRREVMGINAIELATGFTFASISRKGEVEVPKNYALAVLHGLATGQHWWYNGVQPTEAEYTNTQKEVKQLLEEGAWWTHENAAFWQPKVEFSKSGATWRPWSGRLGRSIEFSFEGEKCIVKWTAKRQSNFIGGVLWALGAHEKISLKEI